jgi:RNA polymerase sigma-70 factor (ECF subfamily)
MSYSEHSDGELLLMFKSGDGMAFNVLFDRHWQSLFRLAKGVLDDEHLAKDAIQEAFAALYMRAKEKQIAHVRSYLYQAVKYQCFMHLRAGKISEKHLRRLQLVSSANDVEEYINAMELEVLLGDRIQLLPEKCREVFYLSRYELLPNNKIAEQLNISQKTVEHQLTKALKALRHSIDKLAVIALFTDFLHFF